MPFVKKYMLYILLLANMTSEYRLLAPISQVFFYSILGISVLVLVLNITEVVKILKKEPEILGLIAVFFIAQFIFQIDIISTDNVIYTITKIVVFGIIVLSVYSNYDFYLKKVPMVFSYIIVVLVLGGWFINKTGQYGGLQFGFDNRNVACTVATAGIAGFLFLRERLRLFDYACIVFLLITILYGGSRNALAMCVLIVCIRYGLSLRLVAAGILFIALILWVFPEMGLEITAYERLKGTFDGTVAIDREIERETALMMIAMRPLSGWGYYYVIPQSVGITMGAHNGYLAMIEILGYPCGVAALLFIGIGCIRCLKLYKHHNKALNYCLAIVLATLFAANQESYLVGVNQFTTNYFFVAFVILRMYRYQRHSA